MDERRQRAAIDVEPQRLSLRLELAQALAREGRSEDARVELERAARAGLDPTRIGEMASALRLGSWFGRRGQSPLRSWLGALPSAPSLRWSYQSPHEDDRFGLPLCVTPQRAIVIAQSVVVGMRYVRIVALDLTTGRVAWEHERRNLFGPTGAFVLGGAGSPQRVGWGFAEPSATEGFDLCVATYDLATGAGGPTHRLSFAEALVLAPSTDLLRLDDAIFWAVSWTDEELRHSGLVEIDADHGTMSARVLPAVSGRSLCAIGERRFGIARDALLDLGGAITGSLLYPFDTPRGEVEHGRQNDEAFATHEAVYFHAPHYATYGEGRLRLLNQVHRLTLDGDAMEHEALGELEAECRYLCADPSGAVFVVEESGGDPLVWELRGDARRVVDRLPSDRLRFVLGASMGGALLLFASLDKQETDLPEGWLRAYGQHGLLWELDVREVLHQFPVPCFEGILGVSERGVSLYGDHA